MKIGYIRVSSLDQNPDRQIKLLRNKGVQKLYIDKISGKDFLELIELFKTKGVGVISLKEPIDTTTPQGKMIVTIFASMYKMERESIRERQREGIEVARDRGVQFGRLKIKIDNKFIKVYNRWKNGKNYSD